MKIDFPHSLNIKPISLLTVSKSIPDQTEPLNKSNKMLFLDYGVSHVSITHKAELVHIQRSGSASSCGGVPDFKFFDVGNGFKDLLDFDPFKEEFKTKLIDNEFVANWLLGLISSIRWIAQQFGNNNIMRENEIFLFPRRSLVDVFFGALNKLAIS